MEYSNGDIVPKASVLYTIVSSTGKTYSIKVYSADCYLKTERTSSASAENAKGIAAKIISDLKGTIEGKLEMEKQSGLPLTGDLFLKLTGEVKRFDMVIPVNLSITIHFEKK